MLVMAGLLFAAVSVAPAKAADVSFGFFYSNLSPHGSWMVSGSYGNVWQPRVYTADWNPYYDGHWVYTDCGWTWVSDYPWGGIPYHYGTWVRDPLLGWVWVPGYVWGPSWVVFRSGPDYIGWAPVPPSFSIGMSFGSVSVDPSFYVFVPSRAFVDTRVRTVIVPRYQTKVIVNKTRIVNNNITIQNNVVVNRGPDVRVVERESGRRIQQVPIERVRNVSATGTVRRDQIRVDETRVRGRRVAEPVKGSIDEARGKGGNQQGGKGRRDRESANAPAPSSTVTPSPKTPRPDDTAGVQERRGNRPAQASTGTQTTTPRTRPQPAERQHEQRGRRHDVSENPAQQPEQAPRVRPEKPLPPTPAPEPPRVKPNEPPTDASTNAQKPAHGGSQEKGNPPVKKKGKPSTDKEQGEKPPKEASNQ